MRHWQAPFVARVLAVVTAGALSITCRAAGQDVGPDKPSTPFNQGPFRIAALARGPLHQLWNASVDAKQERVACVGGYVDDDVVYITHVRVLPSSRADSVNVSALPSLQECSPPEWFGTVHTHIARFHGLPYRIFSAPDRFVMSLWRERWKQDGVFCILYTDAEANCEFGMAQSGHAVYGYGRGNNIVF